MHQDVIGERLRTLRDELLALEQASGDAAATVELDQARVGRLSRMDALQSQAMSQEARRRRQLELTRIETALARLQAGEYGWCQCCGEVVEPARLEYDPAAPLCLACASRAEG